MTINGAITQLVMMAENSMMPNIFRPALDKVIETISELEQEPRWIPCSEGIPKKSCECLATIEVKMWGSTYRITRRVKFVDGQFKMGHKVLAWMPLPKPYEE